MKKNLVSFCLYGGVEKYDAGAIENARLMPEIYPGWTMRVYCDCVTSVMGQLESLGVQVIRRGVSHGHEGMFWRFEAANDADYVIFRDCDSRINPREAAAVNAWIKSGKMLHTMHDHPHHESFPIFGGMWGIRGNAVPNFKKLIDAWPNKIDPVQDMWFLRLRLWPLLKDNSITHTSVATMRYGKPFPPHDPYDGFVGEQINAMPIR